MKKNILLGLIAGFLFFGLVGSASATLVAIGTADYDSDGNGV